MARSAATSSCASSTAGVSLEVALLSVIGVMSIGVVVGAIAGYYRGAADTVISRVIDVTMAFPATLFIIALAATADERLNNVTFGVLAPGVVTLVVVFTLFGWFFPARIVRAQVLSLREKEFVEAARMIGASERTHHPLAPPPAPRRSDHRLLDADRGRLRDPRGQLSFLNLGIKLPSASWGNLLSSATEYWATSHCSLVWPDWRYSSPPSRSILLGDGLRDAFDRARRTDDRASAPLRFASCRRATHSIEPRRGCWSCSSASASRRSRRTARTRHRCCRLVDGRVLGSAGCR